MNERSVTLAMVARATDPDRKRSVDKAQRKSSKNQARYYVNLVCEAAGGDVEKFTTVELLNAAVLVAESRVVV
jgi:hypothetical protein